jgi:hypothetical protein
MANASASAHHPVTYFFKIQMMLVISAPCFFSGTPVPSHALFDLLTAVYSSPPKRIFGRLTKSRRVPD